MARSLGRGAHGRAGERAVPGADRGDGLHHPYPDGSYRRGNGAISAVCDRRLPYLDSHRLWAGAGAGERNAGGTGDGAALCRNGDGADVRCLRHRTHRDRGGERHGEILLHHYRQGGYLRCLYVSGEPVSDPAQLHRRHLLAGSHGDGLLGLSCGEGRLLCAEFPL